MESTFLVVIYIEPFCMCYLQYFALQVLQTKMADIYTHKHNKNNEIMNGNE